MRRSVITAIALVSLFLFSAEVGMPQAPNSRQVNINAVHALWLTIKKQLTGPNGEEYFTNSLKAADLPLLIGTLISATPEGQPTTLVLAMSDGTRMVKELIQSWLRAVVQGATRIGSRPPLKC